LELLGAQPVFLLDDMFVDRRETTMKRPLSFSVRERALTQLLTAVGLAAALPLSAAAEGQCFGPFATTDAAGDYCRYLVYDIMYCAAPPEPGAFLEVIGYTTPEGYYAQACCCLALNAAVPQQPEAQQAEQKQDDRSE
jgi:hypothetical protein